MNTSIKKKETFVMKKIMVSFVVLISVFLLAGCGSGQQGITPVGTRTPTVQATVTTSGTASATPSPGPTSPINALWMSDATTGWARTTTHRILHTTDGGKSWQDVTPPYPVGKMGQFPPAFASLNGTMAWVAVFEKQQPDGTIPNVLFRTSDGGHTWQEAMLPRSGLGVSQVQFVNAQDGWVLASYGGVAAGSQAVDLFRSTDGGQTWSTVARAPGSLPLGGDKSGMGWASATTGWVTGCVCAAENTVLLSRTQDGGVTWQSQSLPLPFLQAAITTQPPVFFSATEGLLPVTFNDGGSTILAVYATHDGGATWSHSTLLSAAGSAWDFLTMQQGWVVGANGTSVAVTSNEGQSWLLINPSENFRNISQLDFVSAQEGWAISTATPDAPVLLKTMDGGQTWAQVSSSCGTWNVVPSPNGNGSSVLRAVATVSATDVWAVGGGQLGGSKTLIEHWDGVQWSVVTSPNPGSNYDILDGVTAVSASDVWTVGYDGNAGGVAQTLTEHWDGAQWSVVTSPNPGSGGNTLFGMAAVSASSVWAVGITTSTSEQPLVEHWNGTSWSVVTSPSLPSLNNALFSVAAVSESDVWAVGTSSTTFGQTLIEHWNGTSWSVVTSPSPGSKGSSLSGVAVVSASSIWAVGDFMKSGSQQALVEHWNGTSWQVVPSPSVGTSSTFWAVGAVSAKDVWAVGDTANGNQGFQTLTEQWNGSRWSVVTSPSPGSTNTSLNGVAAISASSVWAVGNAESNTLTEHYQC